MEGEVSWGRAGMIRGGSELDTLPEAECWSLLERHRLGRLAVIVDGRPRVFPVNYAIGERTIVIRTGPGSKLRWGPGAEVCFEIDGYEETTGSGWSVMAAGTLEDITERPDVYADRLRHLGVRPQPPGERSHWLALSPAEVTGRAFTVGWVPGHFLG